MFILQFYGIYTDAIEKSSKIIDAAFNKYGFSINEIDDAYDIILEDLKKNGTFEYITNSIIYSNFSVARDLILQKYPDEKIDFYVNCYDSHFYINGESVDIDE
ncbi:MAG: hypothetical protein IJP08_03365 [Bacteroidaceae bacterium]|nr:hypothetical protein [Bacteroidaceae bacterium]